MEDKRARKINSAAHKEHVVGKELPDNFCLYEKNYDGLEGFPK